MVFLQTEDGAAFVTARSDYGEQAPLWLLDRLDRRSAARAPWSMVAGDTDADRFAGLADQAVRRRAQGAARAGAGRLVVEVPTSQADLDRALGAEDHTYDAIAAVTTPVDGSLVAVRADAHLRQPAGVLAAGGAGRADRDEPRGGARGHRRGDLVHAHVAAGGVRRLRRAGPRRPARRGDREPDPQAGPQGGGAAHAAGPGRVRDREHRLGASYEAAWLACRLHRRDVRRGQADRVLRAGRPRRSATAAAFREVLGTTEKRFTPAWRDQLRELAG